MCRRQWSTTRSPLLLNSFPPLVQRRQTRESTETPWLSFNRGYTHKTFTLLSYSRYTFSTQSISTLTSPLALLNINLQRKNDKGRTCLNYLFFNFFTPSPVKLRSAPVTVRYTSLMEFNLPLWGVKTSCRDYRAKPNLTSSSNMHISSTVILATKPTQ